MKPKEILQANVLDILFEGKNKSYGAYELRMNYSKRITKALLVTMSILGLPLFIFGLTNKTEIVKPKFATTEVTLVEIKKDEVKPPPPPPPPPKEVQTTQPNTIKFTTPLIVENPDEPPPAQTDLQNADISTITRKGDTCQVAPLPIDPMGISGDDIVGPDIFERVEIEASFPGGAEKWKRYLERTLISVNPADEGAPEGTYTTIVQFVVDIDGSISDVKSLTNFGYGMEDVAIKAIERGPKWNPAIQNGRQVKAYRRQMITFRVISE